MVDPIPASSLGMSIANPLKRKFDPHQLLPDIAAKKAFSVFFGGAGVFLFLEILEYNLDIRCQLEREIFHDVKVQKISNNNKHIYSIT